MFYMEKMLLHELFCFVTLLRLCGVDWQALPQISIVSWRDLPSINIIDETDEISLI